MSIDWSGILRLLIAPSAIAGGALWLIRWGFDRQAEKFRSALEHDASVQLERVKSALQISGYEFQIRFSKLHTKRSDVLGELFGFIVDVPFDVNKFIIQSPSDYELAALAMRRVGELDVFFRKNRIYLPTELCELLDEFIKKLQKMVIDVQVYWRDRDYVTPQHRQDQMRVMTEAVRSIETEVPALTKRLETEFRLLIDQLVPRPPRFDEDI